MVPSARLGFGVKQLSGSGSSPWLGHLPGRSLPRAIRSERPTLRLAPTTASDGGNTVCRSANAERGPTVHPALSPDGDTAGTSEPPRGRLRAVREGRPPGAQGPPEGPPLESPPCTGVLDTLGARQIWSPLAEEAELEAETIPHG